MAKQIKNLIFHILLSAVILVGSISLTACGYRKYEGEYTDLYSVAAHSLLGTNDLIDDTFQFLPEISILEEDSFGRWLFTYDENSIISHYSLIICQKSDEENVYFYPGYNFISASAETEFLPPEDIIKLFSEEAIEE
jgi:hypothetical protein